MPETFDELIAKAQQLAKQFAEHDPKPWSAETKYADLVAHIGAVGQKILELEGRKPTPAGANKTTELGKELATTLFVLLDLSAEYGIVFDREFSRLLTEIEAQLGRQEDA